MNCILVFFGVDFALKKRLLQLLKTATVLILLLLFSGCVFGSGEEFYALPQTSEEYVQLQSKIDEVMSGDASYAATVSGSHRQSVQLIDIDGNGEEEALVFFRTGGEKPLKICVFESQSGNYDLVARIEGDGSSIESIEYYDLDGDGWREIIVGWQMSADMRILKAYSMKNFQATERMMTEYSEYAVSDLDGDGRTDIVVLHYDAAQQSGSAEVFHFWKTGDITSSRAPLSLGLESVDRIKTGAIKDGRPALFVEGGYNGSGVLTDILAMEGGLVKNLSLGDDGISRLTRDFVVYCSDINDDGVMDIPQTVQKTQYGDNPGSFYLLEWYSYTIRGARSYTMTTYHNFSDGWYFILDEAWGREISVRRVDSVSGVRQMVFSTKLSNGKIVDFLTIFTLTGENRREWAEIQGRMTLTKQTDTIYAAQILTDPAIWPNCPTEESVRGGFRLIYTEWVTGLT